MTRRGAISILPVGILALALSAMIGGCGRPRPTLHVVTWNIAHGRGARIIQIALPPEEFRASIDRIAAVLAREGPEVVALQEADAPSSWSGRFDHVRRLREAAGYPEVHHGLHADNDALDVHYGTALLARRPLDSRGTHASTVGRLDTKGLVWAEIELDERPLLVASVHLDFASRSRRCKQVRQLIDHLPGHHPPIVLMGDLNCQWNDQDALGLLAERLNLRVHQPESAEWATFPSTNPTRRIDWILISPELEFVDYHVWPEQLSDHRAVAATLRWRD